ncbi:hypothetical protein RIF25_16385 [Thermosynechococcaceae cyanobacterium BACA0444]|uniref:Uncharacterized protein n=1 Tax=Pseudocalidococcus azoricus BACA0444 TaxID=2918990 RepID=A0AAE4K115_9CYAN|nr:hypothetical protein [Pseudocalidococcus azoricus]MDS3862377.1 hypothetical protein [Pseudocalidococcus azoricus BACA0444]
MPENQPQIPGPRPAESITSNESEKILCPHCLRTATNGIKCQGICVADSDY